MPNEGEEGKKKRLVKKGPTITTRLEKKGHTEGKE